MVIYWADLIIYWHYLTSAPAVSWWQWSDWSSPPDDWSRCFSSSSPHQRTKKEEWQSLIHSSEDFPSHPIFWMIWWWVGLWHYLHLLIHFHIDGFHLVQLMPQSDQCVLFKKNKNFKQDSNAHFDVIWEWASSRLQIWNDAVLLSHSFALNVTFHSTSFMLLVRSQKCPKRCILNNYYMH